MLRVLLFVLVWFVSILPFVLISRAKGYNKWWMLAALIWAVVLAFPFATQVVAWTF